MGHAASRLDLLPELIVVSACLATGRLAPVESVITHPFEWLLGDAILVDEDLDGTRWQRQKQKQWQ